ncbi:MAG TPA: lytic murein transglycosylase, partial [Solirubrobacteraceae bacterium]
MHARTLLIAIITAFLAVLALAGSPARARADAPSAGQAQCVNADGSPIIDPATGAPVPCSATDPQPPAATPDPAPPAPDPTTPATDPAPASAPAAPMDTSTTPQTDAPSAGTQEPQSVEPGTSKSNPISKHQGKPRKRHRHGQPADPGHTGPDDSNPPPPPSSLIRPGGSSGSGGTSGSGSGAPADAVGGGGTFPLVSGPVIVPHAVPNIVLDTFRVPPFLLPIYQAAGVEYGVRWEVLAAINSIETDYGRNLSVSTAGAEGWMQFMPGTWATYGVDANRDGRKDPYNPVDAIFTAARYLKAAGAGDSLQKAIFSYNHAQWYVDDVLARARALSAIPAEVIGSLSGLTLGRFPIAARATYAGRLDTKARTGRVRSGSAALTVGSSATRRGMRIYTRPGAPVVAVQDATVVSIGTNRRLGRYVRLRDAYGNTYTYAHLAKVATLHPVPKPRAESESAIRRELGLDGKDPKPTGSATAGSQTATPQTSAQKLSASTLPNTPTTTGVSVASGTTGVSAASGLAAPIFTTQHPGGNGAAAPPAAPAQAPAAPSTPAAPVPAATPPVEQPSTAALVRGVATTPDAPLTAAADSSGRPPLYLRLRAYAKLAMAKLDAAAPTVDVSTFGAYFADKPAGLKRGDYVLKPMRKGAKVIAGTIIGRVGMASLRRSQGTSAGDRVAEQKAARQLHLKRVPHLYFEVRPAGRKSPRIDPKPILDGWRLLDETAIYRARNPVVHSASASDKLTIGQILLMSKDQLARHVLANPNIKMYECGRQDVQAGVIDRRVLATLEFLVSRGIDPTVTALKCGHSLYTTSGNISEHSTGDAVDIAAINGTPINGHQGPGSITDKAVRQLITLQGTMKPHQ